MTIFQKFVLLIMLLFLVISVYDRVHQHHQEVEAQRRAANKEVWDGLHRCESPLTDTYPFTDPESTKVFSKLFRVARISGYRNYSETDQCAIVL